MSSDRAAATIRSSVTIGLVAALLVSACHKEEVAGDDEFHGTAVQVRTQGAEFKVPSKVWDLLLGTGLEGPEGAPEAASAGAKEEGGEGEGAKPSASSGLSTSSSFVYSTIQVFLKEKSFGVLKDHEIRIDLPIGGGEVDLAQWTTGKTGSFFVRFGWEGSEGPESSEQKVIFYGRSKKRRVGDQVVGSGCNVFMDLTPAVMAQKKTGGLTLNTARNFHTTVLGGHFLFSWVNGGTRKVSHVTFRDSKNPQYFCENEK